MNQFDIGAITMLIVTFNIFSYVQREYPKTNFILVGSSSVCKYCYRRKIWMTVNTVWINFLPQKFALLNDCCVSSNFRSVVKLCIKQIWRTRFYEKSGKLKQYLINWKCVKNFKCKVIHVNLIMGKVHLAVRFSLENFFQIC